MTGPDDEVLRGELRDALVGGDAARPGSPRPRPDAAPAQRRDHEPQLPRLGAGHGRALGDPPRRQRHASAGHQPRGRARGDGRGRRGRRGAGGDRVHPPRGLPRDAVHRGLGGQRRGRPPARHARPRRGVAAPRPRRPGDPGPVHPVPDRRGVPGAGAGPGRHDPARVRAGPGDNAPDRARPAHEPGRAAAVPQRPAECELHRRRDADPDRRLGVRRDGRPVLRPRKLLDQPRAGARRGRGAAHGV